MILKKENFLVNKFIGCQISRMYVRRLSIWNLAYICPFYRILSFLLNALENNLQSFFDVYLSKKSRIYVCLKHVCMYFYCTHSKYFKNQLHIGLEAHVNNLGQLTFVYRCFSYFLDKIFIEEMDPLVNFSCYVMCLVISRYYSINYKDNGSIKTVNIFRL